MTLKSKRDYDKKYKEEIGKKFKNSKKYREENKQILQEKAKVYYEKNKERIQERSRDYQEENKERVKVYKSEKFSCECGGQYTREHKPNHLRTKKH